MTRLPSVSLLATLSLFLGILFVQLSTVVDLTSGQSNRFHCDKNFCLDSEQLSPCPVPRNCTTQKHREYLTPRKCNCCPNTFCMDFFKEGEECSVDPLPVEVDVCGPHLTCKEDKSKPTEIVYRCVQKEDTKCMQERKLYNDHFKAGTVGIAQFYPACTGGGDYAPRQCLPGSVCYCTNSLGERIFGLGLPNQKMDCQCSWDIDVIQRVNKFDVSKLGIHCLSNGDYDDLQCHLRYCWCRQKPEVKKEIGKMKELGCYKNHPVKPVPYLRPCEIDRTQIINKIAENANDSIVLLTADMPTCDFSGDFAPVQSIQDKLVCVNKDGDQLENYEVDKKSPLASKIDCHCARVRELIGNSVNARPTCCKIGNFRKWQCSGSFCFCVDKDGKQIVTPGLEPHEVPKGEEDKLICKQESTADDECAY